RLDQALVLQELEGRVDRTGAGAPDAVGAGVELLDDLVAVHRALEQQRQHRGPDVEPAAAASAALASERPARTARTEPAGAAELGAAEREPGAEEAATHAAAVETLCVPHDYLRSVVDSLTIYRRCNGRKGFFKTGGCDACRGRRIWQCDTCADGAHSPTRGVRARGGRADPRPRSLRGRSDRRAGGRARPELVAVRRPRLRAWAGPAGRVDHLVRRAPGAGRLDAERDGRLRRHARLGDPHLLVDHRPVRPGPGSLGPPRRILGPRPGRAAQPAAAGGR